ncbi:E3 SUMO-protein ligase PIAS3, partial [Mytilus galloprovincialis]
MADAGELKQMVMSFRVSELQVLLGYAGRNKTGRKTELMQRALQLVQKGASVPIQIKIRELYNQIFSSNRRKPPGKSDEGPMFSSTKDEHDMKHGGLDYSSGSSLVSPAQSSMFPVHPDVRLKHLPFYDVVAELMKPTSLDLTRPNMKFSICYYTFLSWKLVTSSNYPTGVIYQFIFEMMSLCYVGYLPCFKLFLTTTKIPLKILLKNTIIFNKSISHRHPSCGITFTSCYRIDTSMCNRIQLCILNVFTRVLAVTKA